MIKLRNWQTLGTVNWDEVWAGLERIGFGGALVLESFATIDLAPAAAPCLWRSPGKPPAVAAADGLAFLKAGAAQRGLT